MPFHFSEEAKRRLMELVHSAQEDARITAEAFRAQAARSVYDYAVNAQSQDRQARIKNGYVGPMTKVYGQRVMSKVLSLKPGEWRRL